MFYPNDKHLENQKRRRELSKQKSLSALLVCWFVLYVIFFSRFDFTGWRYLYVRVLVDDEYAENMPDWPERLLKMVEETSDFYEARFRIKLVITSMGNFKTSKPKADYKELIGSDDNDGNDVLIGFTGREIATETGYGADGIAHFYTVLITDHYQNAAAQTDTLKHEIGHLFLAFHRAGTIMDAGGSLHQKEFDNVNWLIVQSSKYQNFGFRKLVYLIYSSLPKNRLITKGL